MRAQLVRRHRRHRAWTPARRAARSCRPARHTGRASARRVPRSVRWPARSRTAGCPRPAPPARPLADGRDRRRVAAVQAHRVGRPRARACRRVRRGSLRPGPGHQMRLRPLVVGGERDARSRRAIRRARRRTRRRSIPGARCATPAGAAATRRGPAARSTRPSSTRDTLRRTALTKPAARALPVARARSTVVATAACGGTRVRSAWYAPSRSTSRTSGCDVGERSIDARGEDLVERAGRAHRAVAELGGQRGVASGQPGRRDELGQREVGVGAVGVDRAQQPVGDLARRRSANALARFDPRAARPVGRGHRPLARRLHRAELDLDGRRPDCDAVPLDPQLARGRARSRRAAGPGRA